MDESIPVLALAENTCLVKRSRYHKSMRELHKPVDIREVAHQAQGEPHGSSAFAIGAQAKIVDGQARLVHRLAEAGMQIAGVKTQSDLAVSRIAEAASTQGDVGFVGFLFFAGLLDLGPLALEK